MKACQQATGWPSPRRRSGSRGSRARRTATSSRRSSGASSATICSSSTRSATCRSSDPRPTSSSRSSPAATSAARSPSPRRGFEQWGEILGDAMVAAALIDRLVHHATMITLKGQELPATRAGSGRRARRSGSVAPRLRLSGSMSYKLEEWCTFRRPLIRAARSFIRATWRPTRRAPPVANRSESVPRHNPATNCLWEPRV
jgi:hypothetical protein